MTGVRYYIGKMFGKADIIDAPADAIAVISMHKLRCSSTASLVQTTDGLEEMAGTCCPVSYACAEASLQHTDQLTGL